jgi:hypothetical protein
MITTQAKSTPVEVLLAETGIRGIATTIKANCLKSYEKALRMNVDHPRHIAATDSVKERLKSVWSFRKVAG